MAEPNVPQDFETALAASLRRSESYGEVLRRWRAGNGFAGSMQPQNSDTRKRRVVVSISKMKSWKRRPCCFNLCRMHRPEPVKKRQAY